MTTFSLCICVKLCTCYNAATMSETIVPLKIEALEEGGYLATSDVLPGLVAQGRTVAEAVEIAQDGARKLIESYMEDGDPLPEGLQPITSGQTVDVGLDRLAEEYLSYSKATKKQSVHARHDRPRLVRFVAFVEAAGSRSRQTSGRPTSRPTRGGSWRTWSQSTAGTACPPPRHSLRPLPDQRARGGAYGRRERAVRIPCPTSGLRSGFGHGERRSAAGSV